MALPAEPGQWRWGLSTVRQGRSLWGPVCVARRSHPLPRGLCHTGDRQEQKRLLALPLSTPNLGMEVGGRPTPSEIANSGRGAVLHRGGPGLTGSRGPGGRCRLLRSHHRTSSPCSGPASAGPREPTGLPALGPSAPEQGLGLPGLRAQLCGHHGGTSPGSASQETLLPLQGPNPAHTVLFPEAPWMPDASSLAMPAGGDVPRGWRGPSRAPFPSLIGFSPAASPPRDLCKSHCRIVL